jgi:choice-of-anchor A domain-containing protein
MRILKILAFSGAALAACSSYAAPLTAAQILTQFNVVSKTTLSSGHDIEGRVVANEITGGATFYNKPSGSVSNYAAINAIKIDNFNANINNGGKVDYQTTNGARFNYNGGGSASQSPSFAMSDFTTPLDALSDQLGLLSANSFVNASDPNRFTFNLTPNAAGTAVFDLSTALLSTSRNLLFSGSAQTIIINVTGASFFDTTNFNADAFLNSHVIWNFEDATSLSFQNWHGAVLAGDAAVTNSSAMEGMLYAKSFTGNGELHDVSFLGTLPADPVPPVTAVPEPATIATFLTGLLMLAFAGRRQRQSRRQRSRVIAA